MFIYLGGGGGGGGGNRARARDLVFNDTIEGSVRMFIYLGAGAYGRRRQGGESAGPAAALQRTQGS